MCVSILGTSPIDAKEKENSDYVDKVSVPGSCFKSNVAVGGEMVGCCPIETD